MMFLTIKELREKYPTCEFGENVYIQPPVEIGKNVRIGNNVLIRPYTIIMNDAKIADNVVIGYNAKIGCNTIITHNCKIPSYANYALSAIIKPNFEGLTVHFKYKYSCAYYYDFKSNNIIIRMDFFHRTIPEWENNFDNYQGEFPIGSKKRKLRLNAYIFTRDTAIVDFQQKMNKNFDYKLIL